MDRMLLNNAVAFGFTAPELVYWSYLAFKIICAALLFCISYRFLRPKLPAKVNCWFCNKNSLVPYNDRECWDCPHCDQYNGFTKDGDYNTDIHKRVGNFRTPQPVDSRQERTNGLCNSCNTNQQLKIQQLARFKPIYDDNYDEEIDLFRKQLETAYRLCPPCEGVLTHTLQSQHYNLITNRMNEHRMINDSAPTKYSKLPLFPSFKKRFCFSLKLISMALLVCFVASSVVVVIGNMPTIWIPPSLNNVCQVLKTSFNWLSTWSSELSMFGTVIFCLAHYAQPSRFGQLSIILWFIQTGISWTDYDNVGLLACLFNLCLQGRILKPPSIFFKKRECPVKNIPSAPLTENPLLVQSLPDVVAKSVEKVIQHENPPTVEEDTMKEAKKLQKHPGAQKLQNNNRMMTRKQAAMKKELPSKENVHSNERKRLGSPPPEVYEGFNNLHLDADTPKAKSSVSKKNWSGILRPAKLVSNKACVTEVSDNCDSSRCSTPSGTSQAPKEPDTIFEGKSTPDRGSYSCNKLSPFYNKFTPPYSYGMEYNDFNTFSGVNPWFYGNGYSPPPSQMFPGSGHTTVYTYTRPSPYSYGFPPQRFSPPFEFGSPLSPRLSEVNNSNHSVSGNQFPSQPASSYWDWAKNVFYAASVVFNIVSVTILLGMVWYGKI